MFLDPPPLTWQQMSQAISWQFLTVGQRGLDEHQLSMIREKIVGECLIASSTDSLTLSQKLSSCYRN